MDVLANNRATDTFPRSTQSETSIAVNGSTVLLAYNDSAQSATTGNFTGYSRSVNNGASFTDMGAPTTPLGQIGTVHGDPVVVADVPRRPTDTSVFYLSNLALNSAGTSIIGVHRSGTGGGGGTPWQFGRNASPLALPGEFQDKEWMSVDTFPGAAGGLVFVCWRRFGGSNGIQFSRSADLGLTFSQLPTNLSSNAEGVQGCSVHADRETLRVIVTWTDFTFDPPLVRGRLSTDSGVTFGAEFTVGAANMPEVTTNCAGELRSVFLDGEVGHFDRAIRSSPMAQVRFDHTRPNVYAVFHRAGLAGGALSDIALSRSTDDGQTWTAPVRVNSVVTGDQFFPSVAVNTQGVITVTYYSTQLSPTRRFIDVYEVISTNGGASFGAPIRLTDVSFDRSRTNPNFDPSVRSCYMGDYNEVTAPHFGLGGAGFYVGWGDNRLDADPGPDVVPDPDIRFDRG